MSLTPPAFVHDPFVSMLHPSAYCQSYVRKPAFRFPFVALSLAEHQAVTLYTGQGVPRGDHTLGRRGNRG